MKISDIATPGLVVLGVAGLAATALAGFAAGALVAKDPEGARRLMRRAVREASRGFEHATRLAAEAREQFGDLVAEAREEARSDAAGSGGERARAAPKRAKRQSSRRARPQGADEVPPGTEAAAR